MDTDTELLEAKRKIEKQASQIAGLTALVERYKELLRLSQRKLFGASSEKTIITGQVSLFNSETREAPSPEPEIEEVVVKRKKRRGKREKDLADLPTEVIDYELPENERACPECGDAMRDIGYDSRREIKYIPAQFVVVEHRQHKYACGRCYKETGTTPIVRQDAPPALISGSLVSASLMAHIMNQKYALALPLYRQEKEFLRMGVNLNRQNMAYWTVYCALNYLSIIRERLIARLLAENILGADETVVQVLHEDEKSARSKSYEWVYRTGGCAEHPIVVYDYQPSREYKHPLNFLKGFKGYLHTDGYDAYHKLPDVTVVGCWAHARRKFDEALTALPPENREDSEAAKGVAFCSKLFALERHFSGMSPEERYKQRLEQSKPISDALFSWAENFRGAIPKNKLVEAAEYLLGQRPYLENVYLDGRLEFSNNRTERSVKPFVMGRKNWLFSNTPDGAQASSIIYTIVETAAENGLKPYEYLKYLFERLPSAKTSEVEGLLPWNADLPAVCRMDISRRELA